MHSICTCLHYAQQIQVSRLLIGVMGAKCESFTRKVEKKKKNHVIIVLFQLFWLLLVPESYVLVLPAPGLAILSPQSNVFPWIWCAKPTKQCTRRYANNS